MTDFRKEAELMAEEVRHMYLTAPDVGMSAEWIRNEHTKINQSALRSAYRAGLLKGADIAEGEMVWAANKNEQEPRAKAYVDGLYRAAIEIRNEIRREAEWER